MASERRGRYPSFPCPRNAGPLTEEALEPLAPQKKAEHEEGGENDDDAKDFQKKFHPASPLDGAPLYRRCRQEGKGKRGRSNGCFREQRPRAHEYNGSWRVKESDDAERGIGGVAGLGGAWGGRKTSCAASEAR